MSEPTGGGGIEQQLAELVGLMRRQAADRTWYLRANDVPPVEQFWGGYRSWPLFRDQSLTGANEVVIPRDVQPRSIRYLIGGSGSHQGGAAAAFLIFFLTNPVFPSGIVLRFLNLVNAGGTFRTIGDTATAATTNLGLLGASAKPIIIPPDYDLQIAWPTTAAGESFIGSLLTVSFPFPPPEGVPSIGLGTVPSLP